MTQMLRAFRKDKRKPAGFDSGDHIGANHFVACGRFGKSFVKALKLESRIGSCDVRWSKPRGTHQDVMIERALLGLLSCTDPVTHRTALHEADWVMTGF